ncbi:hypothetical protein [Candidatus Palauibacter sp.]|uniref:hypothetical protein n=1 Tax=Candidatus Palauibacter sp. TaxID=3101350 RepID=UPI003CC62680
MASTSSTGVSGPKNALMGTMLMAYRLSEEGRTSGALSRSNRSHAAASVGMFARLSSRVSRSIRPDSYASTSCTRSSRPSSQARTRSMRPRSTSVSSAAARRVAIARFFVPSVRARTPMPGSFFRNW